MGVELPLCVVVTLSQNTVLCFLESSWVWDHLFYFTVISVAQKSIQKGGPPMIFKSECDVTDTRHNLSPLIENSKSYEMHTFSADLEQTDCSA